MVLVISDKNILVRDNERELITLKVNEVLEVSDLQADFLIKRYPDNVSFYKVKAKTKTELKAEAELEAKLLEEAKLEAEFNNQVKTEAESDVEVNTDNK